MAVVVAGVMALAGARVSAQQSHAGQIAGAVYDQTGAPLPGVHLAIRGAVERGVDTGEAGDFVFPGLPAGDYELRARMNGYEDVRRMIRVTDHQRVALSITLRLAIPEETTVTAAKLGSGDARQLPMAITSIANADIGRLGSGTVQEVATLAPSVTVSQNTGFGQVSIRGIGTNVVNAGSDPSSAMYLDGVYLARPAMAFLQLLDLERIDVLRGPQGTLQGRNAVGGALHLISKTPTNDAEASAVVTAGSFGQWRVDTRIGGPLKRDRLMLSGAFTRSVHDGYVRDLEHPDHPLGGDDVTAARGQVRVVFTPRTELLVSSDVDHQGGTPLTFSKVIAPKDGFTFDNPRGLHDVRTSTLASSRTRQFGTSARLTAALSPSTTLVSLSAYRSLEYEFVVDADITELDLITTRQRERQHQWSQEITVAHRQPRLNWVGGVFLFDESDHQVYRVDQPAAGLQVRLDPRVDATSRAVFGHVTAGLTSTLSATAGLRYTRERKAMDNAGGRYGLDAPQAPVPGTIYAYADAADHGAWTPRVGVELKLPRDAFGYVSAARGFKSAGFNPSAATAGGGYAPEWAWSYEAGWKGALAGARSWLGVAAFVMDYTNLQVQTPVGIGVFDIRNAAAATIRGIEVENTSRLGRGITAGGHATWLDATYDRYTAVANDGSTGNVTGRRLNNAPEWAGRLWVQWAGTLGSGRRLSLAVDATAQSRVFYTPFNDAIQQQAPYALLGSRIEYGPRDRRWSVAAYARNATDTDYLTATFGTAPTAFGGRPGPSRQFAVEFAVRR